MQECDVQPGSLAALTRALGRKALWEMWFSSKDHLRVCFVTLVLGWIFGCFVLFDTMAPMFCDSISIPAHNYDPRQIRYASYIIH